METRESKQRSPWLIVVIVVAAILALCCILALVVSVLAGLWFLPVRTGVNIGVVTEEASETFDLGPSPRLTIDNFAGDIHVRAGGTSSVEMIVSKRAWGAGDLDRIEVAWEAGANWLEVESRHSMPNPGNVSVEMELSVPPGASVDLRTGAGEVTVTGVEGAITAHSGAGAMTVLGATDTVRLDTGAGGIAYEGVPQGECQFRTGAGGIELTLPADLGARLDLHSGIGDIDLGGFDVDGQVSSNRVQGTIGGGGAAVIFAQTGAGSVELSQR